MVDSFKNPEEIYQQINTELEKVVQSVNALSQDDAVSQEKNSAQLTLSECQQELGQQLNELRRNSEWNRFTIAFYGETGAGKSTLIETLRILLHEPSKVQARKQYDAIHAQLRASETRLQTLNDQVQITQDTLGRFAEQLQALRESYEAPAQVVSHAIDSTQLRHTAALEQLDQQLQAAQAAHQQASQAVQTLQDFIEQHQRTASLWEKFKELFKQLPQKQALREAEAHQQLTQQKQSTATGAVHAQKELHQQEREGLEKQLSDVRLACEMACVQMAGEETRTRIQLTQLQNDRLTQQAQYEQLCQQQLQYVDGEIIGDGRSDHTLLTKQYDFHLHGQDFALLDVPGIEGNETKEVALPVGGKSTVYEQITSAVQRAHAVFYVTNKAAPPQTGDIQTRGTLEKIREHLGSQTEVWSIFNKKISNARHSLKGKELLSQDELASLQGLDEVMSQHLGKHYRKAISLAALPAFLVSTNHFSPGSINISRRQKILDDFTPEDLLRCTQMTPFLEFLASSLVTDCKARIKKSNFNKAHEALRGTLGKLKSIRSNFSKLYKDLGGNEQDAKAQLQSSYASLQGRLRASGSQLISNFESNVRNKVYSRIDEDISNDDFKSSLSYHIDQEQKILQQRFPATLQRDIERFQTDVKDVVDKFQEHAQELTSIYDQLNKTRLNTKIDLKINIDNGIKVGSLLLSIAGGIAAVFGTGGWILVIGLVGLLFSFAKSVWGWFDSDYKKSEQRKSVNQNLSKIVSQLHLSLDTGLEEALPGVRAKLDQIEQAIEVPVKQTGELVALLQHSTDKLTLMSKKIINQGGLS